MIVSIFFLFYIIFLPKANLIHFHNKTIHLQPKCRDNKRLLFFFFFLWADAAYKWMKLRKEIPQRLNSQINNSIKQTIFLFGFRAAVRPGPKLRLIIAFVVGFIQRLSGRTWWFSFFFKQKQNQTKGNKMDLKMATAALSGESPDLGSVLFCDIFLFHGGMLEAYKRQPTTPDKHWIRTHFSSTGPKHDAWRSLMTSYIIMDE